MPEDALVPFIPRLVLAWDQEEPGKLWRRLEGSMIFADLSGFTKMSEKLASKGKVGAEEVTGAIHSTFSSLLETAHLHGGGLLKFGGDALLLFFRGDQHLMHATEVVSRMQRQIGRIGRVETSAGPVRLRMSAGLHTGPFDFFLVGGSHRELIVAGEGSTITGDMETIAEAGEVVMSEAVAVLLEKHGLVGEQKGAGFILKKFNRSLVGSRPNEDPVMPIDLYTFLPERVRAQVSSGDAEAEHRRVSIGFVCFTDIDTMITGAQPEAFAVDLERFISMVQGTCDSFDVCFLGTDVYPRGAKVILTAGAPVATGNDEERLMRALRTISDASELPVKIGANRGHVFAGEIGTEFRRTYTVMGDAVNLAARLMQQAHVGQVLTTESVLDRLDVRVEFERTEPFLPKGKSAAVTPVDIRFISNDPRGRAREQTPLHGRQEELSRLHERLAALHQGGQSVQISGDAGLGKSRLIEEFVSQISGMNIITTQAFQYRSSTPYSIFTSVVRELCGIGADLGAAPAGKVLDEVVSTSAPHLHRWLPLVAAVVGAVVDPTPEADALDPAFRKGKLHEAVVDLIESLTAGPLLFLIEDAHWADEASSELIDHMVVTNRARRWMVIIARRYPDRGYIASPGTLDLEMELAPLGFDAMKAMAKEAGRSLLLSQHRISELARRSGGNPLFLRELIESEGSGSDGGELPESLEAMIASRVDRLSRQERRVLRVASVLGPIFESDLLRQVDESHRLGRDHKVEITRGLGYFLVPEDSKIRFRHDLFREVAYEGLSFKSRRQLHASLGTLIESEMLATASDDEDSEDMLSLHFFAAGEHLKAWRYSLAAGKRAQSRYANTEAATFYKRALEASRRIPDVSTSQVIDLLDDLGKVSEFSGLYEEAIGYYKKARRLATDPLTKAGILRQLGEIELRLGRLDSAMRDWGTGLGLLDRHGDDPMLRTRFLVGRANIVRLRGDLKRSIPIAKQAAEVAERAGDRPGLAHAHSLLQAIYGALGDPEAGKFSEMPLLIYEQIGDLRQLGWVLNNLGADAYDQGRWTDALSYYERSKDVRIRSGDVTGTATIANNIGEIYSDQARLAEAENLFQDALDGWRPSRFEVGIALATSNKGRAAARGGRPDEGLEMLKEAEQRSVALGSEWLTLQCHLWQAEAEVFEGSSPDLLGSDRKGLSPAQLSMIDRLSATVHAKSCDYARSKEAVRSAIATAIESKSLYEEGLAMAVSIHFGIGVPGAEARAEQIASRLGVKDWKPLVGVF
ncbi:MAG: tetratricopeptide repeat protein [Actinomycetota bacterium]|nr:tetratricopeptide repeat protein [Actinomycetota bacterium]